MFVDRIRVMDRGCPTSQILAGWLTWRGSREKNHVDGDRFTDLASGCLGWPDDVLQYDPPDAGMAWRGRMRSRLHVEPTTISPGDVITVDRHGSKVGGTRSVQLTRSTACCRRAPRRRPQRSVRARHERLRVRRARSGPLPALKAAGRDVA